jgi:hypothetical protein
MQETIASHLFRNRNFVGSIPLLETLNGLRETWERISRFFWRLTMNDLCQRFCILLYCTSASGAQEISHHFYLVQLLTNPSSFYKNKTFQFSVEQVRLNISHFKADHKSCQMSPVGSLKKGGRPDAEDASTIPIHLICFSMQLKKLRASQRSSKYWIRLQI